MFPIPLALYAPCAMRHAPCLLLHWGEAYSSGVSGKQKTTKPQRPLRLCGEILPCLSGFLKKNIAVKLLFYYIKYLLL
jgi:hypothetical protein